MRIDYATNEIEIHEDVDKVFNFVSRGAQYHKWHFDYHLRAEPLDVRPGGVGSVFSIEEIIAGFCLRHVGHVVRFEPARRFTWRGRFALFSWIWIGTDFTFQKTDRGTRVREILYFEIFPPLLAVVPVFGLWRAFRPAACRQHILDELTGVKTLIESGDYAPEDVTELMADPALAARVKRYRPALHREQAA